eukprot:421424-Rhodomonas_salina.1
MTRPPSTASTPPAWGDMRLSLWSQEEMAGWAGVVGLRLSGCHQGRLSRHSALELGSAQPLPTSACPPRAMQSPPRVSSVCHSGLPAVSWAWWSASYSPGPCSSWVGLPASLTSRQWAGLPASLTGMGVPEGARSASRPEASAAEPTAPSPVP